MCYQNSVYGYLGFETINDVYDTNEDLFSPLDIIAKLLILNTKNSQRNRPGDSNP